MNKKEIEELSPGDILFYREGNCKGDFHFVRMYGPRYYDGYRNMILEVINGENISGWDSSTLIREYQSRATNTYIILSYMSFPHLSKKGIPLKDPHKEEEYLFPEISKL